MAEAAYRLSIANNVTLGFGTAATLSSEAYMHLIWGQWAVGTQSGSNVGSVGSYNVFTAMRWRAHSSDQAKRWSARTQFEVEEKSLEVIGSHYTRPPITRQSNDAAIARSTVRVAPSTVHRSCLSSRDPAETQKHRRNRSSSYDASLQTREPLP
ncbi:uncharacterized protein SEPMUDRAFT_108589 [Sphaerulina musiva SO2202]|uniref:Uncharacterized protein n=1 Tax=Sphaerulina musiva (strain SO2202) TaxID=692275 RepID=N1QEY0_SPHMS|nr:uncharacterized protein SEPMUDRAFT_108589 [Sphaerulina musiva SO2202]EMF11738.1 hypothetical protein SEPMUDRAFT_108589 [Sphaerulina musiva SO2202]